MQHRLGAFLGSTLAATIGAVAIYFMGPWSVEPIPQTGVPRPVAPPASVSGRVVTVLGAGDILLHPELWDQARRDGGGKLDFAPMFTSVKPAISNADLALCHLETPLAPPNGPYHGFPRFSVPQDVAQGIKSVGFDGCSTASNHALDQGYDGVKRTLDTLDRAGLRHSGTYRSAQEAQRPTIYNVRGVRVAHLSYTKHFNGLNRPSGQEWVANLIEPRRIGADADAARAAGAEIVVVSLHWGTEYEHEPDADQQTWAREVAAMPSVDLVFGHHAHVVQPVERIADTWIIFGMGNQIARHAEPVNENREGVMIRVTFSPATKARVWKVAAIEAIPIFVDLNPDIHVIDLERALADPATSPGRRRIYEAAVDRIQSHLLTRAADRSGLIVRGARAQGG